MLVHSSQLALIRSRSFSVSLCFPLFLFVFSFFFLFNELSTCFLFVFIFSFCCSYCLVAQFVSDSVTPWTVACQASLSFTVSWSLFKLMSIESVMPSNHLILCRPLLLLPSVLKMKLQYSGHLMRRANSLEKTLIMGKN